MNPKAPRVRRAGEGQPLERLDTASSLPVDRLTRLGIPDGAVAYLRAAWDSLTADDQQAWARDWAVLTDDELRAEIGDVPEQWSAPDGTIDEVMSWVDSAASDTERAGRVAAALSAERAGQNRKTLLARLEDG